MTQIKYIIAAILCLLSINCPAQRMLSEVASMKGVSSVYIGKTMLKLAGGASMSITGNKSSIDLSKLFKDLTSIEVISCEDRGVAEKVEKKCKSILSRYPMEVLSETSSDGQNVQISGVFDKDGRNLETLLIAVTGKNEASFILLKGKIDIVTLNNAILVD
ncbi:MAG: DUF4252 domain-containing protein [Muribaculaceae bacterium]|nr:DUF4252 domain-containing protein [Muribaculaceae bacterium]